MHLNALLDQNVAVLTASRRLAHAVRVGYARHAQQHGLAAWRTPRALSWSAWLRQQRLEARAAANAPETRVLTTAQARVLWEDVVATSRAAGELLNPSNAARLAARSWRRMHDYLLPLERLQAFETPEAMALYAWCGEFESRCATLDAIDEARLAHWAHDSGFTPQERLAFAGFDLIPPALARLIERWRAPGLIVDLEDATRPIGVPDEIGAPGIHAGRAAAGISLVGAADAAAEIELAAHWARAQLEAGVGEVGVVLGDLQARREEVRRVFEDVFAPGMRHTESRAIALPVAVAAPAPLSAYPLVDAALLVLQLASGECSSTHAGRILRSPFIGGGEEQREQRALADLRLREEQRDRWDWFEMERWAGVTGCEQLQLAARELTGILRGRQGDSSTVAAASQWAERFQAMLVSIGWPGDRTLSSVEHQTLEKFYAALAEFGALDAVTNRMNMRQALRRLQDLLRDTPFEPETGVVAVTVIDATTSAGMQFDALWVAGLTADRLPAPINPDPLIPLELQRAAGMPEASPAGVLHQATVQLQRWTKSGAAVVLSWPQRDGDAELSMSPLVAGVCEAQLETMAAVRTTPLRNLVFEHRPMLATLQDDRAPALASEAARGGARILELQARCPFRAQAELRLGAQPLPRVSLGVEPLDRGALLHRVLFEIWGGLRTQQALLALDDRALEDRVRESASRQAAQALRPTTRHRNRLAALEIESAVRQVMRLLTLEKQRPPFTIRFAEAAEPYAIGGLAITLRPDRIDELADGGELLIDYKLGAAHRPRDWLDLWPGRPPRPQLPLYGLAHADRLSALAYVVLAPGAVEYRGWSNGADVGPGVAPYPSGIRIDLGDPVDWEALMHQWRFTLTRLAERFVAGEASVDPLPMECASCHLSTLCRIHERALNESAGEAQSDE